MRVLVTEDDPVSALVLEATLRKAGYLVEVARTGSEAVDRFGSGPFDALVLDWMLPGLDGIEVARLARQKLSPAPLVLMVTALGLAAREHALASGADEFLAKPVRPSELLDVLARGIARVRQVSAPARGATTSVARPSGSPANPAASALAPYPAVAIAASTGGPEAVRAVFARELPPAAAYFVLVHGPGWMQESIATALGKTTKLAVSVARPGEEVSPGHVYLAAGDRHLVVTGTLRLELGDGPLVNFVRPAADPLFKSVARVFGASSVGVVLTGVGADGALGAAAIAGAGGTVLVQDPESAAAPSMPRAAIKALGTRARVHALPNVAPSLAEAVSALAPFRRADALGPRP